MVANVEAAMNREMEDSVYRSVAVEGLSPIEMHLVWERPVDDIAAMCRAAEKRKMAALGGLDPPAERLALAEQLAIERLEFLYSEAMGAWRRSQEAGAANGRPACGQPRYLAIGARISMQMAEFQLRMFAAYEVLRARLAKMQAEESPIPENDHPVRDCSAPAAVAGGTNNEQSTASDTTCSSDGCCDNSADTRRAFMAARELHAGTVQPEDQGGIRGVSGEGPAGCDLPAHPLNRQQRRARQRKLERLRRKGR